MSAPELLPCPFCGSVDVEAVEFFNYAQCMVCGATGPMGNSEQDGISAWNTRTFPGAKPCQANPAQESNAPAPGN